MTDTVFPQTSAAQSLNKNAVIFFFFFPVVNMSGWRARHISSSTFQITRHTVQMHIKYLRLVTDYTITWDTVIEKWSMNAFHNIDMYNFDSRKEKYCYTFTQLTSGISSMQLRLPRVAKKCTEHYPTCFKLLMGSLWYQSAASWQVRTEGSRLTFRSAMCCCFRCIPCWQHAEKSVLTWQWNVSLGLSRLFKLHLQKGLLSLIWQNCGFQIHSFTSIQPPWHTACSVPPKWKWIQSWKMMVKKSHSSSTFTACSTSIKMVVLLIKRKEAHSSYTITFISVSSPEGSSPVSHWFEIGHGKLLEALVLATFNHYMDCRKKGKKKNL